MDIQIDTTPTRDLLENICWNCGGTGKIKAMQAMMTYDAGSIRGPDTTVKCPYCKGTGIRRKE